MSDLLCLIFVLNGIKPGARYFHIYVCGPNYKVSFLRTLLWAKIDQTSKKIDRFIYFKCPPLELKASETNEQMDLEPSRALVS